MKLFYDFLTDMYADFWRLLASGWGLAIVAALSAWLLVVTFRWMLDGLAEERLSRKRASAARRRRPMVTAIL